MPLAEVGRSIAAGAKQLGICGLAFGSRIDMSRGRSVCDRSACPGPIRRGDAQSGRNLPGKQTGSARCAHGSRRVGMGESHALPGQLLDVRRGVEIAFRLGQAFISGHGKPGPAEIIHKNQPEVRRVRPGRCAAEGGLLAGLSSRDVLGGPSGCEGRAGDGFGSRFLFARPGDGARSLRRWGAS